MESEIIIQKENILKAYKQASEEQKALLENMFGKDMFKPKDIRERIKTFHDAYCELGNEHPFVKSYEKYVNIASGEEIDIIAYLKLRIICAALNGGWKPKFTEDEYRWYPWFALWTQEELKLLGKISYTTSGCNLSAVDTSSVWTHSSLNYSARLSFKTRGLTEYCGKQFIDIWINFLSA